MDGRKLAKPLPVVEAIAGDKTDYEVSDDYAEIDIKTILAYSFAVMPLADAHGYWPS